MKFRIPLSIVLLVSMIPLYAVKNDQDVIIRKANTPAPAGVVRQKQLSKPAQAQEPMTEQEEPSEEGPNPLTEEEQLEIFKQMNLPGTEQSKGS